MKKHAYVALALAAVMLFAGCSVNAYGETKADYEEVKPLIEKVNEFSIDIAENMAESGEGFFISPISIYTALACISNGAEGNALEEFRDVLYPSGYDDEKFNSANYELLAAVTGREDTVLINTMIAADKQFNLNENFSKTAQKYFAATIENMDLYENESVSRINTWAEEKTNGMIKQLISEPICADIALLNSIYFEGQWQNEFSANDIYEDTFYGSEKETDVEYLFKNTEQMYYEDEFMQATKQQYSGGCSMNIYLPKEGISANEIIAKVQDVDFYETKLALSMPKYELEYEVDLKKVLSKMGLNAMFCGEMGGLSETDQPMQIEKVKQKAKIKVDEKGTEAAAVTIVTAKVMSIMPDETKTMTVNRPFIFTITADIDEQEQILFIGMVNQL